MLYHAHLSLIPAYWIGGMATHGLLLGGLVGVWIFSRLEQRPFLSVTDALAIPAAVIMGLGRIGNYIDGQIVGSVTTAWWAVKFPDADGFRHPVVLYDGLKNLLIVPILFFVGKWHLPQGVKTGIFLFLYAFLRIFVDIFREYPTTLFGLETGQVLNLLLSVLGLGLVIVLLWRHRVQQEASAPQRIAALANPRTGGLTWRRLLFAAILLFALTMPSDWSQDVPSRYGHRHAGLQHSVIYPKIP